MNPFPAESDKDRPLTPPEIISEIRWVLNQQFQDEDAIRMIHELVFQ